MGRTKLIHDPVPIVPVPFVTMNESATRVDLVDRKPEQAPIVRACVCVLSLARSSCSSHLRIILSDSSTLLSRNSNQVTEN